MASFSVNEPCAERSLRLSTDTNFCVGYRSDERQGMVMLSSVITTETPSRIPEICGEDGSLCRDYAKSPWEDIQVGL